MHACAHAHKYTQKKIQIGLERSEVDYWCEKRCVLSLDLKELRVGDCRREGEYLPSEQTEQYYCKPQLSDRYLIFNTKSTTEVISGQPHNNMSSVPRTLLSSMLDSIDTINSNKAVIHYQLIFNTLNLPKTAGS